MKKHFLLSGCISLLVGSICFSQSTASSFNKGDIDSKQDGVESLHGVLQKAQLERPLRNGIRHIRFSPDGKYVLAQDVTTIHVLKREPFVPYFEIEAANVSLAQFTSDSQRIAFYDWELHVQVWNLTTKTLSGRLTPIKTAYCQQSELSPDAKTFACLDGDGDLVLTDVGTGSQIYRKAEFYSRVGEIPYIYLNPDVTVTANFSDIRGRVINMDFSADGRYFVAGGRSMTRRQLMDTGRTVSGADKDGFPNQYEANPNNVNNTSDKLGVTGPTGNFTKELKVAAFDMTTRKSIDIGDPLKSLLAGRFVFIGSDKIIGSPLTGKSELVAFPDGKPILSMSFDKVDFEVPGRGNYVLVRPMGKYPVGIVDLKSGSVLMANKKSAIDLYDNVYVAERSEGELGLYEVGKSELRAKVELPQSSMANIQAVAISPDFKWLALSGVATAAVWDLTNGKRVFSLRGFGGAYYSEEGAFYVDFPKYDATPRTIGILQIQQQQVAQGQPVEDAPVASLEQYGKFFTILRSLKPPKYIFEIGEIKVPIASVGRDEEQVNKNASLEVRDVRTMKSLWLKTFEKQTPGLWVDAANETMVLGWSVYDDFAKDEIKKDSKLTKQLNAMKEKGYKSLFQVLDASTGQSRGSFLFLFAGEQGSVYINYVLATNDTAVVATSQQGILVYSLTSGEKKGQIPGNYATVSRDSNLLCVRDKKGQLTIYDIATLKVLDQFNFLSPVAMAKISSDGKRLFVLTHGQTAYVLEISSRQT